MTARYKGAMLLMERYGSRIGIVNVRKESGKVSTLNFAGTRCSRLLADTKIKVAATANSRSMPLLITHTSPHALAKAHRIVICFAISLLLPDMPPCADSDGWPGFFSNSFQNLRLSSAARLRQSPSLPHHERRNGSPAVASICPSGLRQLCSTRVSCAGISTLRTSVG